MLLMKSDDAGIFEDVMRECDYRNVDNKNERRMKLSN